MDTPHEVYYSEHYSYIWSPLSAPSKVLKRMRMCYKRCLRKIVHTPVIWLVKHAFKLYLIENNVIVNFSTNVPIHLTALTDIVKRPYDRKLPLAEWSACFLRHAWFTNVDIFWHTTDEYRLVHRHWTEWGATPTGCTYSSSKAGVLSKRPAGSVWSPAFLACLII